MKSQVEFDGGYCIPTGSQMLRLRTVNLLENDI
jgi:hypothetical protein